MNDAPKPWEMKWDGKKSAPSAPQPEAEAPKVDAANLYLGYAPKAMEGAVNKVRETTSLPLLRLLANKGFKPAQNEIGAIDEARKTHIYAPGERAGEVLGDIGITSAIDVLTGGLGTFALPAVMAAQHQVQNYARGEKMSPGEATVDYATGLIPPFLGKGVQAGAKAGAFKILENVIKPTGRYAGIDLEPVLARAKGFKKYFEGLGKVRKVGNTEIPMSGLAKRVSEDVGEQGANRLAMMKKAGVTGNFPAATATTEASLLSRTPELGQRGLTPGEQKAALRAARSWEGTKPDLSAKELQGLIQKADDMAYKSSRDYNLAPQENYSRELARSLRGQREEGINLGAETGKLTRDDLIGYRESRQALRGLTPALEAIKDRALAPELSGSYLKTINPLKIPVGRYADRLITRPGTANLFYDIGQAASNPNARYFGRKGLDLSRAAIFSPGENQ